MSLHDEQYQPDLDHESEGGVIIRTMAEGDLGAVIDTDALTVGHHREAYFKEKFQACVRDPGLNTSLVAVRDGLVVGYLFGRIFHGEFGMPFQRAVLDTIGINPRLSGHHIASALVSQYRRNMQALRVEAIDTLVAWDRFDLLRFFQSVGFGPSRDMDLMWDLRKYPFHGRETGVEVRTATMDDLETVVTLDGEVMGMQRREFLRARLDSAQARPGNNRVLLARVDGITIGYLSGRIYRGEFGIEEVRGVIEAIGVRSESQQQGVGSALLEGLLAWLEGENVQWVETLVHWNDWSLLRFMEYAGFRPSSRINLQWKFD